MAWDVDILLFDQLDLQALAEGDVLRVLEQDESGWWYGEKGKVQGWFPSNFIYVKRDLYTIEEVATPRSPRTDASGTESGGEIEETNLETIEE